MKLGIIKGAKRNRTSESQNKNESAKKPASLAFFTTKSISNATDAFFTDATIDVTQPKHRKPRTPTKMYFGSKRLIVQMYFYLA